MSVLLLAMLTVAPQGRSLHEALQPHPTSVAGVEVGAELFVDAFGVVSGGVERGLRPLGLAGLELRADLGVLVGAEGWTADVHGLWAMDGGLSAAVGDLQGVSNIEAPDLDAWLSEAWVMGPLAPGVELQLGKMDANDHFAETQAGADFIAGPFGTSPVESAFPTYPETAFGARLAWDIDEQHVLQLGLYDGGLLEGRRTSLTGPGRFIEGRSSHFIVAELARIRPGDGTHASFGVWHSTADALLLDGGTKSGTTGAYFTLDRSFGLGDENSLDAFFQFGIADPDVLAFQLRGALGLAVSGLNDARPDDSYGLGASWVGGAESDVLSGDGEVLVEAYWRAQFTDHIVLQPAAMMSIAPAGDPAASDAVILGLRAILSW